MLGSLLAGVAALSLAGTPHAQAVELEDYRKARETGFDLIYEARDLNLTQAERDGLTQARTDLGATRKRLQQSEKSIDKDLEQWIRKNYWCVVHWKWEGPVVCVVGVVRWKGFGAAMWERPHW